MIRSRYSPWPIDKRVILFKPGIGPAIKLSAKQYNEYMKTLDATATQLTEDSFLVVTSMGTWDMCKESITKEFPKCRYLDERP